MNPYRAVMLSIAIILVSVPILASYDSDADWNPEETWYCYGNVMTLKYPYDATGLSIEWTITIYENGTVTETRHETGAAIAMDMGDADSARVVQNVTSLSTGDSDSKSIEVVVLGLKPGQSITVRFMDGTREIAHDTLDMTRSVMLGNPFVDMPEDPSKNGYRFTGWYYDQACTQGFNPLIPVLTDTVVYAGWEYAGSSGTVEVSGYIVTFNAVEGLEYCIVGTGDRAVSFTVSVKNGYRFDADSITASVGASKIAPVNGIYTLSGISGDTTVEITGDRLHAVSYDLKHASLSSEELTKDSLKASFSPDFGWIGMDIRVIMGGIDVTAMYVDGTGIDIPELTGDVIVIAQAEMPWIYIAITLVIIAIIVSAAAILRKRNA